VAVFSGMLGVTLFGIFLTPVFYNVIQWFSDRRLRRRAEGLPSPSGRGAGGEGGGNRLQS
jgi:multidrug efflux pump